MSKALITESLLTNISKAIDSTDKTPAQMATALQTAIASANTTTGESDTTIVDAVQSLSNGYGGASGSEIETFIDKRQTYGTTFFSEVAFGKQGYSACYLRAYAFYDWQGTEVSMPNATYIPGNCFSSCGNLQQINIPSVTECGTNAFAMSGITALEMPEYSTTIPNNMCNQCGSLAFADLGNASQINTNVFNANRSLAVVILRKLDAVCVLGNVSAFAGTPIRGYNNLTGIIYVPSTLIESYKVATNWSSIYAEGYVTFASIEGSDYE